MHRQNFSSHSFSRLNIHQSKGKITKWKARSSHTAEINDSPLNSARGHFPFVLWWYWHLRGETQLWLSLLEFIKIKQGSSPRMRALLLTGREGYSNTQQNGKGGVENRHYRGRKAPPDFRFTQHCYSNSGKIKMTSPNQDCHNQYCSYCPTQ